MAVDTRPELRCQLWLVNGPGPIIGKNRLFNFDIYSFGLGVTDGESECAELANACQTRSLGSRIVLILLRKGRIMFE